MGGVSGRVQARKQVATWGTTALSAIARIVAAPVGAGGLLAGGIRAEGGEDATANPDRRPHVGNRNAVVAGDCGRGGQSGGGPEIRASWDRLHRHR